MATIKLSTKEVQSRVDAVTAWHSDPSNWEGTEPKDTFLYDSALSGFGAKITKAGNASWFVEKRFAGKTKRKRLGDYPAMPIEDARKQCQIMLGQMAAGIDISKDRRAAVALQREAMQGKTLAAWYTEYHKTVDDGTRYRREQMRTFNNWVMPVVGQKPVKTISKHDLKALLTGLGRWPQYQVDNLLRPFCRWLCEEHSVWEVSPMATIKRPKKATPRQRTLTDDEIRGFWHASRRMGPLYGNYYKLLLLLASRKTETKRMRWSDIDFMRREWRIPAEDTKTGRNHIVHLSNEALAVLQGIKRGESPYVFANGDGKPIDAGSEPWHVMLALMDKPTATCTDIRRVAKWEYEGVVPQIAVEGFTQHDLRRTVSTRMVGDLGIAPWVADKIQNHVAESTVRRTYQVVEYMKERRAAIELWGKYVAKLVAAA
jgi:integrase